MPKALKTNPHLNVKCEKKNKTFLNWNSLSAALMNCYSKFSIVSILGHIVTIMYYEQTEKQGVELIQRTHAHR